MDRIGERSRRDVGRGGRLLLRRAALARPRARAAEGALDGRAAAASARSTVFEGERRRNTRSWADDRRLFRKRVPELTAFIHDPRPTGLHGPKGGVCCRSSTRPSCAACSPTCSTRTSSSGPTAFARSRAITLDHPYVFHVGGQEYRVPYLPGESDTGMFGGNSNWRGPVWMPVNVLIIRALLNLLQLLRR